MIDHRRCIPYWSKGTINLIYFEKQLKLQCTMVPTRNIICIYVQIQTHLLFPPFDSFKIIGYIKSNNVYTSQIIK